MQGQCAWRDTAATCSADSCTAAQVWVSPVRPMVIEALLSFTKLEAVRLEAYSSLETACCFAALKHLPALTHLDLRLSGSHYALADNLDALHSLAKCLRLVSASSCMHLCALAAARQAQCAAAHHQSGCPPLAGHVPAPGQLLSLHTSLRSGCSQASSATAQCRTAARHICSVARPPAAGSVWQASRCLLFGALPVLIAACISAHLVGDTTHL